MVEIEKATGEISHPLHLSISSEECSYPYCRYQDNIKKVDIEQRRQKLMQHNAQLRQKGQLLRQEEAALVPIFDMLLEESIGLPEDFRQLASVSVGVYSNSLSERVLAPSVSSRSDASVPLRSPGVQIR